MSTPREELTTALDLTSTTVQSILDDLKESAQDMTPPSDWKAPAGIPLLPDLMRLAVKNRRQAMRLRDKKGAIHEAA